MIMRVRGDQTQVLTWTQQVFLSVDQSPTDLQTACIKQENYRLTMKDWILEFKIVGIIGGGITDRGES